jgi:hypothetical protein
MAQCPSCQSENVVVTEEVFTRKGRAYYRFIQTVLVLAIMGISVALNEPLTGFLVAIFVSVILSVLSVVNAGKRALSKTKLSCLNCKTKTYL